MNLFFNIGFVVVSGFFMILYIFTFVLNLVRAIKVKNEMKESNSEIKGIVTGIDKVKKTVYVKVKYVSRQNGCEFMDYYQFTEHDFKDQYYVDQEVTLIYANLKNVKKIHCFPVYLKEMPIKIEKGPVVTDLMVALGGTYFFIQSLVNTIVNDGFKVNTEYYTSVMWVVLTMIIYMVLMSYVVERLVSISSDQNQNYLKLCGYRGKAQVKTFKFGRQKDQKGNKESQMKIEFYTSTGEKVLANLNSFMYSETQEEYIDILYDPRNPQNVVYMRS